MMSPELILLSLALLLLFILLMVALGIRRTLAQVQFRLHQQTDLKEGAANAAESEAKESAFQAFLDEDPQRLGLSKSEQFAAFREWRRQKGMNWSNS